jgi:hypothetical protein
VRADGWKIRNFFRDNSGLVSGVAELMPFSKPFSCLCNCLRFAWTVSTMGGGLPAWQDGPWCCWRSVVLSALSPLSASISIDLSGAKKFRVGTSGFYHNWGSLTPMVDVVGSWLFVGVVCRFPLSSSLLTKFLDGWRCSNCGVDCFPFGSVLFEGCRQVV